MLSRYALEKFGFPTKVSVTTLQISYKKQDWKFFSVQDREIINHRNFSILRLLLGSKSAILQKIVWGYINLLANELFKKI